MSGMPCIRSYQPSINPMRWLLIIIFLLLVFVITAHVLGMPTELILLVIAAVIGAAVKLVKALPRLQFQGAL